MLKILGRGTSGNVQKVVWLLEELGQPYSREDYGRQFNNTQTEAYLQLESERQGADARRRRGGRLGIEHDSALYLQQARPAARRSIPPTPRRAARSSAGWTGSSPRSTRPYLGVFREAKKKEEERAASFAADVKELCGAARDPGEGHGRAAVDRRVRIFPSPIFAWGRSSIAPGLPGRRCRRFRASGPGATSSCPATAYKKSKA